jgi:hypothetical protein
LFSSGAYRRKDEEFQLASSRKSELASDDIGAFGVYQQIAKKPKEAAVTIGDDGVEAAKVAESQAPLRVRWEVQNLAKATSELTDWVRAKHGAITAQDERHLSVQLASSDIPMFLKAFSSVPQDEKEANKALSKEVIPATQSAPVASSLAMPISWVSVELELVPTE